MDLDPVEPLLAAICVCDAATQLSCWQLPTLARSDVALPAATTCVLTMGSLVVTLGDSLAVWRHGSLWASAEQPGQALLRLLRLQGEFVVLSADGLTFWRVDDECDADTGAGLRAHGVERDG